MGVTRRRAPRVDWRLASLFAAAAAVGLQAPWMPVSSASHMLVHGSLPRCRPGRQATLVPLVVAAPAGRRRSSANPRPTCTQVPAPVGRRHCLLACLAAAGREEWQRVNVAGAGGGCWGVDPRAGRSRPAPGMACCPECSRQRDTLHDHQRDIHIAGTRNGGCQPVDDRGGNCGVQEAQQAAE